MTRPGCHVYVLESESTGRFYIGMTQDLLGRVAAHNRGQTPSTRGRGPWRLVYHESFATRAEAGRRERYLKSLKSRAALETLIGARSSATASSE